MYNNASIVYHIINLMKVLKVVMLLVNILVFNGEESCAFLPLSVFIIAAEVTQFHLVFKKLHVLLHNVVIRLHNMQRNTPLYLYYTSLT